jgi:hypothetical protein
MGLDICLNYLKDAVMPNLSHFLGGTEKNYEIPGTKRALTILYNTKNE